MATIDEQIADLEAALATGAASVRNGEEQVNFRPQAELRSELARLKAVQNGQANGPKLRLMVPRTGRGL